MILAIDLGSTSFKAGVIDADANIIGEGSALLDYHYAEGGIVELAPDHIAERARVAIDSALEVSGVDVADLQAIGITSQAQTFAVCDAAGNPRTSFISWQDARPQRDNRAARELSDFAEHTSVGECLPVLLVAKLAYIQDRKESFITPDDVVLHLPTWLVQALSGRAVIDPNLAAMSGLYSLQQADWWDAALACCEITRSNLPELVPTASIAARTNGAFGLPAGIPIVLAGNDQTAGAYGAGVHASDALLITLGTAQVAYRTSPELPPTTPGTMRGPYPDGRSYQMVADEHGGCTTNWAKQVLPGCTTDESFTQAAASAGDLGGLRFIADGDAGSGHWEGETAAQGSAEKAKAVLICLANRLHEMIRRMGPDVLEQGVLLAGGGRKCGPWVECLKDKLPVELQPTDASPLLGCAAMAMTALTKEKDNKG